MLHFYRQISLTKFDPFSDEGAADLAPKKISINPLRLQQVKIKRPGVVRSSPATDEKEITELPPEMAGRSDGLEDWILKRVYGTSRFKKATTKITNQLQQAGIAKASIKWYFKGEILYFDPKENKFRFQQIVYLEFDRTTAYDQKSATDLQTGGSRKIDAVLTIELVPVYLGGRILATEEVTSLELSDQALQQYPALIQQFPVRDLNKDFSDLQRKHEKEVAVLFCLSDTETDSDPDSPKRKLPRHEASGENIDEKATESSEEDWREDFEEPSTELSDKHEDLLARQQRELDEKQAEIEALNTKKLAEFTAILHKLHIHLQKIMLLTSMATNDEPLWKKFIVALQLHLKSMQDLTPVLAEFEGIKKQISAPDFILQLNNFRNKHQVKLNLAQQTSAQLQAHIAAFSQGTLQSTLGGSATIFSTKPLTLLPALFAKPALQIPERFRELHGILPTTVQQQLAVQLAPYFDQLLAIDTANRLWPQDQNEPNYHGATFQEIFNSLKIWDKQGRLDSSIVLDFYRKYYAGLNSKYRNELNAWLENENVLRECNKKEILQIITDQVDWETSDGADYTTVDFQQAFFALRIAHKKKSLAIEQLTPFCETRFASATQQQKNDLTKWVINNCSEKCCNALKDAALQTKPANIRFAENWYSLPPVIKGILHVAAICTAGLAYGLAYLHLRRKRSDDEDILYPNQTEFQGKKLPVPKPKTSNRLSAVKEFLSKAKVKTFGQIAHALRPTKKAFEIAIASLQTPKTSVEKVEWATPKAITRHREHSDEAWRLGLEKLLKKLAIDLDHEEYPTTYACKNINNFLQKSTIYEKFRYAIFPLGAVTEETLRIKYAIQKFVNGVTSEPQLENEILAKVAGVIVEILSHYKMPISSKPGFSMIPLNDKIAFVTAFAKDILPADSLDLFKSYGQKLFAMTLTALENCKLSPIEKLNVLTSLKQTFAQAFSIKVSMRPIRDIYKSALQEIALDPTTTIAAKNKLRAEVRAMVQEYSGNNFVEVPTAEYTKVPGWTGDDPLQLSSELSLIDESAATFTPTAEVPSELPAVKNSVLATLTQAVTLTPQQTTPDKAAEIQHRI